MARGKPGKAQLDMVSDMLSILTDPKDCVSDGTDVRNYGELSGLSAAKRLFADILGCKPEECFIGGNASLTLMYDTVSKAYTHGMIHSEKPHKMYTFILLLTFLILRLYNELVNLRFYKSFLYICLWLFKYKNTSAVFFYFILTLSLEMSDEPDLLGKWFISFCR